jgi:hypothetical protein
MKITEALNPHKNNIQIKTNKDDAKDANVWDRSKQYDQVSRVPLDSRTIDTSPTYL